MICKQETPLCATQGDDEIFELTFTLDGTTPLDLTGSTINFVAVKSQDAPDADAVITKTATIITPATDGKATLELSNTDTNQPLGTYFYRMKLVSADSKVKTIMKGTLSIEWAR